MFEKKWEKKSNETDLSLIELVVNQTKLPIETKKKY